jgi:ABC-type multidrug transport system fused ATPase/permease subunit
VLRAIGRRARLAIGVAAVATLLERLAIVAATFEAISDQALSAVAIGSALAAVFVLRSAVRSFLRVEVQSCLIGTVSTALLADDSELGGALADDTELALVDGLYASEVLIGEHVPELLGDVPACACMVAIACVALPARLVVEGGAVIALGALAMLASRRLTTKSADRVWEAFEPLLEDLSTAVRGGVELVASGNADRFLSSLATKTQRWRSLSTRASLLSFLAGRAPAVAVAFAAGLVLILDEGLRGSVLHGVLGRAVLLASMTPAFAGLTRAWLEVGKSGARIRPVAALIERGARQVGREDPPPRLPAVITLDHVHFGYGEGQAAVIVDLVATFRPGEVVALTGANGSGKSTLLALLLGLASPTEGTISVAAVDLGRVDLRLWRQGVGYLSQRPFLPDRATARVAIRLLAPDARDDALERALRQVELWPVLCARSPGAPLDARVGSLSAGEKQRLALARVLARRAPVLLLDEPDANLDAEGLGLLASLLRELAPGRCVVIAAHSPQLVSAADRVVSLSRDGHAGVEVPPGGPSSKDERAIEAVTSD